MNDSIAFITCVNKEKEYAECIRYIHNLNIPDAFSIEIIAIRNAESMASGYNEAMNKSKSKYKVYLHQDTLIINKNFIYDILNLFRDDKVGMIGVIGCEKLPTDAVWWNSKCQTGKVYKKSQGYLSLINNDDNLHYSTKTVQAIDGLIMVTQNDFTWREDLFDGYHFYDISQCMEFRRNNLNVIVPYQDKPWCLHDCTLNTLNTLENYEVYRNIFLDEYSKDIYPLVSVLIPTYNKPELFKKALDSVERQTYRNIEVIICDDSTNNIIEELISGYIRKYKNIAYYKNEKNLGQFDNDLKLMSLSNGRYINFLMDDDLFKERKIEKMMNFFIFDANDEISLVSSNREVINSEGELIRRFIPDELIDFIGDKIFDPKEIFEYVVENNNNIIGEPTTVLFDKTKLHEQFGVFNKRRYICNVDQASWFDLMQHGKVVVIKEPLSCFRISEQQQSMNDEMIIGGMLDYVFTIENAREFNYFNDIKDYYYAVKKCLQYVLYIKYKFNNVDNIDAIIGRLKNIIQDIRNSCTDPLVSILIPAYNQTEFLKIALDSAVNQTYINTEIIIGDDSTNDKVREFLQPYLETYSNIVYFKNNRDGMDYGYKNVNELFARSHGEYINYLNHDDIFYINKIEKMVDLFKENPNVVLVTSPRSVINENGKIVKASGAFEPLSEKDVVLNGKEISRLNLMRLTNYIGEPTTVLFKKKYITEGKYGFFNNKKIRIISDIANWINILQHGDMGYLAEPLSAFRISEVQNSAKKEVQIDSISGWLDLIENSYETNLLTTDEYRNLLQKCYREIAEPIMKRHLTGCDALKQKITGEFISAYQKTIKDTVNL